jgi:serine/threonine protein kinase
MEIFLNVSVCLNSMESCCRGNLALDVMKKKCVQCYSYFGSFERDGVLMIEMEYADGGTMAQMLSRRARRLDEREILMLFRQIVAAIQYMHDHNILHRYV